MSSRSIKAFKNTYPSGKATTEEGAKKLWRQYLDTLEDPKKSKKKPQDFYEKPKEENSSEKKDKSESTSSEETVQVLEELGTTPTETTISEEKANSFVSKFLEKAKSVSKGVAKAIKDAPLATKQFITDTKFRKKALKKSADMLRENSSTIAKAIWDSTKSESIDFARPFTAPVTVAKRLKNGERPLLTKDEKFSLYSGLVYWGCIIGSYSLSHMGGGGATEHHDMLTATKQIGDAALNSIMTHIILGAVVNAFQAYFKKDPKKNMPNKAQIEQGIKDSELSEEEKEHILSELVHIQDNPNKLFLFFEQIENTALYFQIATGTNFLKEMGVTFATSDLYGIIGADAFKNLFGKAADVLTKLGAEDKAKIKEYEGYVNDFADALEATTDDDIVQALEGNGDCVLKGTKDLVKGMEKEEKKKDTKKAFEQRMIRRITIAHLSKQGAYKEKKKVKNQEGKETTIYIYSDEQIAKRNKKKSEQIEKLRKCISDLRSKYKRDMDSEDERLSVIATATSLVDLTCERIGNPQSADNGHFGITGLQKRHIKFSTGKATLTYVGKSGVKQVKEITDAKVISKLKDLTKKKLKEENIFTYGEKLVSARLVNTYLKDFGISAKDIRGYHANEEMKKALKAIRKEGGKLPTEEKEKAKQLKKEFSQALKQVAKIVGHQASTLKNQYLVPHMESSYCDNGKVITSLKKSSLIEKVANAHLAKKTDAEKEDDQVEAIHKKNPKERPPRYDLRKRRIEEEDKDLETGVKADKDLSLKHEDYKRTASERLSSMWFSANQDKKIKVWDKQKKDVSYVSEQNAKENPRYTEYVGQDEDEDTEEELSNIPMDEDSEGWEWEDSEEWEMRSEEEDYSQQPYQPGLGQEFPDTLSEPFADDPNDFSGSEFDSLFDSPEEAPMVWSDEGNGIALSWSSPEAFNNAPHENIIREMTPSGYANQYENDVDTGFLYCDMAASQRLLDQNLSDKQKEAAKATVSDIRRKLAEKDAINYTGTHQKELIMFSIGALRSLEKEKNGNIPNVEGFVKALQQDPQRIKDFFTMAFGEDIGEAFADEKKGVLVNGEFDKYLDERPDDLTLEEQVEKSYNWYIEAHTNKEREERINDTLNMDIWETHEEPLLSESKSTETVFFDNPITPPKPTPVPKGNKGKGKKETNSEKITNRLVSSYPNLKEQLESISENEELLKSIEKEIKQVEDKIFNGSVLGVDEIKKAFSEGDSLADDASEEDKAKYHKAKAIKDAYLTNPDAMGGVSISSNLGTTVDLDDRLTGTFRQVSHYEGKHLEELEKNLNNKMADMVDKESEEYDQLKAVKLGVDTYKVMSTAKSGFISKIMGSVSAKDLSDPEKAEIVEEKAKRISKLINSDSANRKDLIKEELSSSSFDELSSIIKNKSFDGVEKVAALNPQAAPYLKELMVDFYAKFESDEDFDQILKSIEKKEKQQTRDELKKQKFQLEQKQSENINKMIISILETEFDEDDPESSMLASQKAGRIAMLCNFAKNNGNGEITNSDLKELKKVYPSLFSDELGEDEVLLAVKGTNYEKTETWTADTKSGEIKYGGKNKNNIIRYFDTEEKAKSWANNKIANAHIQSFVYNDMNIDSYINSTNSIRRKKTMSNKKQSALKVSATLDRIASLFENSFDSLGIPEKIAKDFAFRCDLLSDTIESNVGVDKQALDGLDPVLEPGFNPDDIGREVGGPLEDGGEHAWQEGEFSRQEHRELRDLQESGAISDVNEDPRSPAPGRQAKEEEKEEEKEEKSEEKSDESSEKEKEMEKKEEELKEQRENHKQSALEDAISRLSKQADGSAIAQCSALRDQLKICCVKLQESGEAQVKSLANACDKLVSALDKIKEECIKAEALGQEDMALDDACEKACGAVKEILPFMERLCLSINSLDSDSPVAQYQVGEVLEQTSVKMEKLVGLAAKIVADAISSLSSSEA